MLRTHSFVFFAVHETHRIFLSPFISKASRHVSSFFLRVQLSQLIPARNCASVGTSYGLMSVCLSEVGVLLKWLKARELLLTYSTSKSVLPSGTHTYTHPFNGPLSGSTRVSRYWKGKINLDFKEAGDSEWQWHQLHHMQVCTLTTPLTTTPATHHSVFLQARCPSCRPANSIKALKAITSHWNFA